MPILSHHHLQLHARLLKSNPPNPFFWNLLLTFYNTHPTSALALFLDIPSPDLVSHNALLSSHSHSPLAFRLFRSLLRSPFRPDSRSLSSSLKSSAATRDLNFTSQLHSVIHKVGFGTDDYVATALIDAYSKCGAAVAVACGVLDGVMVGGCNVVPWNAVMAACGRGGEGERVWGVFRRMEWVGVRPDEASFATVLAGLEDSGRLGGLHGRIVRCGWGRDRVVGNAMVAAYCRCGGIWGAEKVFDEMRGYRDLVGWNSMLAGYVIGEAGELAFGLFAVMKRGGVEVDAYSLTSVISACFETEGFFGWGRVLHGLVVRIGFGNDVMVANSLVAMYVKASDGCGWEDAVRCFDEMEFRDNVSWNSVLTALSQNGLSEEAMKFFCRMACCGVEIDHFAFSAALRSCSDLAVLKLGRQAHGSLVKSGFGLNEFVVSSLIYMYSKSGVIDEARRTFDESNKGSSVTWNTIIFAYAQHGKGHIALEIFSEMQKCKIEPDHITFVGVLSACSHIGLVEEGTKILHSMETIYGIPLRMEHYACGVDLCGRAGRFDAAKKLINSMPFEPDALVWMTLLGACRIHGEIDLASQVASHLLLLEPKEHSTYVLLSHMCSRLKLWESKAVIQKAMRERGVNKVPGWSWIEVDNKVYSFNAEDRSHPQADYIYERLTELTEEMGNLITDADVQCSIQNSDYY